MDGILHDIVDMYMYYCQALILVSFEYMHVIQDHELWILYSHVGTSRASLQTISEKINLIHRFFLTFLHLSQTNHC